MKAVILNAFTTAPNGGNPAGVVMDAKGLSEQRMQAVAKQLGFSETAFVLPSEQADFQVRFFTPEGELDLCGHATIATFAGMAQQGLIQPGHYRQETKAGVLGVTVHGDGRVFMQQNLPEFSEPVDSSEIADALNCHKQDLDDTLPAQVVSTGLRDILVPVRSLEKLLSLQPDFAKVAELSRRHQTIGMHLFSLESLNNATAHCRNLAPLYDIPEEAATGTSNGALACYLLQRGRIPEHMAKALTFEQGYSMDRPSEIQVQLELREQRIIQVLVGGTAVLIEERPIPA